MNIPTPITQNSTQNSPQNSPQNGTQNVADLYPLSPMQQGMLFHTLLSPDTQIYVPQLDLTLEGDLDADRLRQSWHQVVDQHPVLRTAFQWEKRDQPFQVVYRQVPLPWQGLDWSQDNLDSQSLTDRLQQQLASDRQAFDLKVAPLMRLTLIRISPTQHHLIWTQHHLILDGWSAGLILKDVFACYHHIAVSARRPYRDYIAWVQQQDQAAAQTFWKQQLAGFTEPTLLPFNSTHPSPCWDEQEIRLSPQIAAPLKSLAQTHQLTLNTIIQGAFALLLSRYTDCTDICFGATQSGRSFPGSDSMIGLFINTLPVRVNVLADRPLISWLQELQAQQVAAMQYDHSPLMDIQTWSDIPPGTPLFETLLVFENYPVDPSLTQPDQALRLTQARSIEWNSLPLTLLATDTLTLKAKFDRHRFPPDAIARLLTHFQTLLQAMTVQPEACLSEFSLLSISELQQLQAWNQTTAPYPQQPLPNLWAAQVEKTPDAIALVFADQHLTYQELDRRAKAIAENLVDSPQDIIGVCAERSLDLVVMLLGVLQSGAAYLALDPALPGDRLAFMVEDAGVKTILTTAPFASCFPGAECLILDDLMIQEENEVRSVERSINLDSPFSVLYTSGSTGMPKGVVNTHRGIVNRLHWMQSEYGLTVSDRVLQKTPYSFDVSIWEFFWTLLNGACLVIARPDGHKDSAYLVETIAQQQITTLHFVPSMLQVFLEEPALSNCTTIQRVLCSGEALPTALAQQFHTKLHAELHNLYGPTEAAIDVTAFPVSPQIHAGVTVPIGYPIANTQIHLLDRHLQPVPIGVPGELYIGGVGLAQGYLNRPELTAERFITRGTDRLYKTGDRARYLSDGAIEFLGRIDYQIKLRGFRIELGEIEAALLRHRQIQSAAVLLDQSSHPQIVAYVVPCDRTEDLSTILSQFLSEFLPEYMIPSTYMVLDTLPLLTNGKLDRRSLLALLSVLPPVPNSIIAPRNATESIITDIWKQVLKIDTISVTDSFFDLGGNSLLATRINSRLRQAFQIDLPLRTLFQHPTIAALASTITPQSRLSSYPPIQPSTPPYPLSFAQQRLWFLEQIQGGTYNIPVAVKLTGTLNVAALEQSLNALIDRHASLRTHFQIIDGEPTQIIHDHCPLLLPVEDFQSIVPAQQSVLLEQQAIASAQTPFNLVTDPLLRVRLFQLNAAEHVILLTLHHIITDGWSMDVLLRELTHFYTSFDRHSSPTLPPLPIQYADFAHWQRQWLQGEVLETQLAYWQKQLGGTLPVLQLPTDFPRARVQTFQGAIANFAIPLPLSQRLQTLSQSTGTTLFMTLLAAYKVLLHRYTGQTDIIVGSPIANRHYPEVEGLIGFFVNTLVLRTDLSRNPSFNQILKRVQETTWNAYDHQDLPFEKLVEVLHPDRDLSYNPLFQVKFRLENPPTETFTVPGLTLTSLNRVIPTAKLDLSLDLYETPAGLVGAFEYNCDLFSADTIDRLIAHFTTLLESIVQNPDQPISNLPLLTPAEQQQYQIWNATDTNPDPRLFHQIFESHAAQTPDAIALVYETQHLTYAELNHRANALAHHLITLGVCPETLVAICIDRTPDLIIALLATLKAGGAYLPLDPAYPPDRLCFMLTDSQAALLLSHSSSPDLSITIPMIVLDAEHPWSHQPVHNPSSPVTPQNLAYLIYTSGSTGTPKGVLVPHAGLTNLTEDKIRVCQVRPHHCILQFFSFSFDASIPEIILALGSGAKLCLAPRSALQPGDPLLHLLRQQAVTHMTITPSALSVLPPIELPALEMVLVGGEAPSVDLMQRWSQGRLFINAYGPTETTVNASMVPCGNGHPLQPTLRPSANKQLHVLDDHLQPLPIGAIGELHIGGVGLARGYHQRPDLTAEKFIPDPFCPGGRLYKTGDLAAFLPDGRIKLLGRIDHQVKIRGFRIEPGEIEALLTQGDRIQSALVRVHQDNPTDPHDQRLVAYLVPLPGVAPPTAQDLRRSLKTCLPDYMVPNAYVFLNALPLTPNGKVDQRALPAPDPRSHTPLIQPRTPIEEKLVDIFKTVLEIESVSIQDDFFELGGHSLLATRLIARSLQEFQVELTVVDLFEAPTIAELSDRITHKTLQSLPSDAVADRDEIEF